MYSLNVPVPAAIGRLATDLASELPGARPRARGEQTLVVKRFPTDVPYHRLEARVRDVLAGQPAFEVAVTEIEQFETAVMGPSPVVYLAVEGPELTRLHATLAEAFDPVPDLEGDDYVPHVTIARGGSPESAAALTERSIESRTFDVTNLVFRDAERGEDVSRLSLPA